MPDFKYERKLWRNGFKLVAGCDEVGRGCFAGPVIAGCVIFSPHTLYALQGASFKAVRIDDSKKLTALQREKANDWIKENCLAWGIGVGSVAEINRLGIVKATNSAIRRAIKSVNEKSDTRVEYLLIDAFYIPYVRGNNMPFKSQKRSNRRAMKLKDIKPYASQLAIINGDEKSVSIAAASIIAKVYRDRLMTSLSDEFKDYKWERNKGYGTREHIIAIEKHGLTKHHRRRFVETYFNNSSSFPTRSGT